MLATLVIGLREGLEAALIVGILAAFLRRAGKPMRAMWMGVGAAIALSIAVGVILEVVSADLPQAQQEGMESIIGVVAVVIVTGMIGWMNQHARSMRADLEVSAQQALGEGTAWALVGMAFLAVLKEGFETSVFLLAAFQSASSPLTAGTGAIIGVALAVAIGIGIYRGGVKINLGKFFKVTGFFLVLVAAGLVLSSLRTAHEAGWITIGQQTTVNLSWLAPTGSIQAALLTGVLGIPADPRVIEVLGWFAYLVPVMLYLLWPVARRPKRTQLPALWLSIAGASAVAALALAAFVQLPAPYAPVAAPLSSADRSSTGLARYSASTATLTTSIDGATTRHAINHTVADSHDGVDAQLWETRSTAAPIGAPSTLSLDALVALADGRMPIGMNASQNPGPFTASWNSVSTTSAWFVGGALLDARSKVISTVTLTDGGLSSSRTMSLATPNQPSSWTVASSFVTSTVTGIESTTAQRAELLLWKLYLPILLALTAMILVVHTIRFRAKSKRLAAVAPVKTEAPRAPATAHI
jgi:high-affinity iron transporter